MPASSTIRTLLPSDALKSPVLKQSFNRDRIFETHFPQFVDGASGRSDGDQGLSGLEQSAADLPESGGLAGSGGAADVDRAIVRIQDKVHNLSLFGIQAGRGAERMDATQAAADADAVIDGVDHLPFTLQALLGRDFVALAQNDAGGLLRREEFLQFLAINLAPAMAERFGEDFVVARDRYPLEDMILRILQRRFRRGKRDRRHFSHWRPVYATTTLRRFPGGHAGIVSRLPSRCFEVCRRAFRERERQLLGW